MGSIVVTGARSIIVDCENRPFSVSAIFMKTLTHMLIFPLASFVYGTADDLRIGMIGLDTSHVTAFTELLNLSSSGKPVSRPYCSLTRSTASTKLSPWSLDGQMPFFRDKLQSQSR
jgi:hypothetical protein